MGFYLLQMLLFIALVVLPAVMARRAFPVGVDRDVESLFQEINPRIVS